MPVEYPVRKFDSFGREYFTAHSSTIKIARKFWGDTKKIKIVYRIYNKDVQVCVYDLNGKMIMTNERGSFEIRMRYFKFYQEKLWCIVHPNILEGWSKKIKKHGSKNSKQV